METKNEVVRKGEFWPTFCKRHPRVESVTGYQTVDVQIGTVFDIKYTLNKHIHFWRYVADTLSNRTSATVTVLASILPATRKISVPDNFTKNNIDVFLG